MFWMPAILRSIIDFLLVTSISTPSTSHRTIEHTFKASYRPRKYPSKYLGNVFGRRRLWISPESPGEELSLSSMPVCPAFQPGQCADHLANANWYVRHVTIE